MSPSFAHHAHDISLVVFECAVLLGSLALLVGAGVIAWGVLSAVPQCVLEARHARLKRKHSKLKRDFNGLITKFKAVQQEKA